MEERKHIVILAAGDFPTHEVPLRALREADFVVCCDSAYREWRVEGGERRTDFVVIGDGDSLSADDKAALGNRWLQVDEQDYNDLHKAMVYATAHYPLPTTHFTILGATGRREDHTLGNISYLVTFGEEHPGADIEMLTDHGRFFAIPPLSALHSPLSTFPGQQVSVFSMEPEKPIYGSGLKWPLEGFHARRWWQATLNEALADSVELRSEGWLVVFLTYAAKQTL